MAIPVATLKEVMGAGGGLSVDARGLRRQAIIELARQARAGGGMLIVRNAGKVPAATLVKAAVAGAGRVLFEV